MINSRLKPVFGIRPGLFLLLLITAFFLLLFFLFLFLPGILHNGSLLTVTSSPERSAVYIDDVYRGAAPLTLFVEKGRHDITVKKQYFSTFQEDIDIRGRIFGSLFSKHKTSVNAVMEIEDLHGYLNNQLNRLYSLSLIREFSSTYRYPAPAEEILHDLRHQPDVFASVYWKQFVSFFPLLASSETIINDMLVLLKSEHVIQADPSAGRTVQELQNQKMLIQGNTQELSSYHEEKSVFFPADSRKAFYAADLHMLFEYIPGGSFIYGNDTYTAGDPLYALPHRVETDGFYILDSPVTWSMYSEFLNENPEWRKDALSELHEKGYADNFYLADSSSSSDSSSEPASYISYYAAEAFCLWLSEKIQEDLSGWTAALPTSVQWEHAFAYAASQKKNMQFLMTNWEWTSSIYYPASPSGAFLYDKRPAPFSLDADMCLKGGSPISRKSLVSEYTNGAADPAATSPVISFRPVLIPE